LEKAERVNRGKQGGRRLEGRREGDDWRGTGREKVEGSRERVNGGKQGGRRLEGSRQGDE
jgi:hypothetical protein